MTCPQSVRVRVESTWRFCRITSVLTLVVARQERHPACKVHICIWPSWCHCHLLSLAPVNPDWFYIPGCTFLVPADLGSPGQTPEDRKMVVVVVVLQDYQNVRHHFWHVIDAICDYPCVWPAGVIADTLHLELRGSTPGRYAFGKLFTHSPLSPGSIFPSSHRPVILYGWVGNRTSGVALARTLLVKDVHQHKQGDD